MDGAGPAMLAQFSGSYDRILESIDPLRGAADVRLSTTDGLSAAGPPPKSRDHRMVDTI